MGTAFAGIVRAPMTSVVMIFEITRDYAVIVPLMISNLVSFFISSRLQREPIYEVLAHQDGIHLPSRATQSDGQRHVAQAMQPAAATLNADATARTAVERIAGTTSKAWLVTDQRGVIGVLTPEELRNLAQHQPDEPIRASVAPLEFPHLHADHPLSVALERMGATRLELLPVVSRANVHQLLGVVTLQDVLALYGVANR